VFADAQISVKTRNIYMVNGVRVTFRVGIRVRVSVFTL
jgi:hypothetical protein